MRAQLGADSANCGAFTNRKANHMFVSRIAWDTQADASSQSITVPRNATLRQIVISANYDASGDGDFGRVSVASDANNPSGAGESAEFTNVMAELLMGVNDYTVGIMGADGGPLVVPVNQSFKQGDKIYVHINVSNGTVDYSVLLYWS